MGKLAELIVQSGEWIGLEAYQTQYWVRLIVAAILISYTYRVIIHGKV